MNSLDVLNKLNRIKRYLLDMRDFRAFDVAEKAFMAVAEDCKAEAKRRHAARKEAAHV